jgi:hypothetical protein
VALRQVAASAKIAARLPPGMCRMLGAVPTRVDPTTGVVEVAAIDALDAHVASEFSFHLGQPVRLVRGAMAAVEEAIRRMELGDAGTVAARTRRKTPAFPHGAPDSVPPPPPVPPPEEVPIPLVRRASIAPAPDSEDVPIPLTGGRASDPGKRAAPRQTLPPSFEDGPARLVPATASQDAGRGSSLERGARAEASLAQDRRPSTPPHRPVLDPTPSPSGAAVSFPSTPPPPPSPADQGRSIAPRTPHAPARQPAGPDIGVAAPAAVEELELTPLPEDRGPALPVPGAMGASFGSLAEILVAVGRAGDRDAVIELALTAMLRVAERAAIFVVRKEAFQGWVCNPAFGAEEQLREVLVAQRVPSIFATAVAAGYYLGPIPGTAAHAGVAAVMGGSSAEVAVVVVRVAGRPALLLVADQLDDTLLGTRALGEVASRVGAALERVVMRRG